MRKAIVTLGVLLCSMQVMAATTTPQDTAASKGEIKLAAASPAATTTVQPAPVAVPIQKASDTMGDFSLLSKTTENNNLIIARVNKKTGEAWYRNNDKWVKSLDEKSVPNSQYEFDIVVFRLQGWALIRMDKMNGRTWTLEGNGWREVLEG